MGSGSFERLIERLIERGVVFVKQPPPQSP